MLEREGFTIRAISGTSAGGLWGAFYAAGYSAQEIETRMQQVRRDNLYARKSNDAPAMLGLAGLEELLIEILGDRGFEDLRIPFAVTAVDINTAEAVILRRGRVREALLATIAVPGVFPPKPFKIWARFYNLAKKKRTPYWRAFCLPLDKRVTRAVNLLPAQLW